MLVWHGFGSITNGFVSALRFSWPWASPLVLRPFMIILYLLRLLIEVIILALNAKVLPSGLCLRDVSAVCQQVDLRLQQACFWPWQIMIFRKKGWRRIPSNRAQYIR